VLGWLSRIRTSEIGSVAPSAGTTPHPKRSRTMDIIRSGSQAPVKGPAEYFTGEVTIE
jgi:hypothetical protein